MWDGLFLLLCFCIVMGVASFLAGLLPLSFGLSQNHSRVISAIGTGILVGTCLIIIIPEGIETLYSAAEETPTHGRAHTHRDTPSSHLSTEPAHSHSHSQPHAFVGLSLIAGFVLMYLIDHLPQHASSSSNTQKPLQISLANLSQGLHRASSPTSGAEDDNILPHHHRRTSSLASMNDPLDSSLLSTLSPHTSATTIGLVIHAAADGIALAASSFVSEPSVGFVVFVALMIHKAPAAFGLTSVLLKQGLSKRQARGHLVVFSLAAPVGALGTWLLVNLFAGGGGASGGGIEGGETTKFWTGLLLLFSGGTFLYVAMHTMQETASSPHTHHQTGAASGSNGYVDANVYTSNMTRQDQDDGQTGLRDTLLSVVGMLLPLLAQVGHAH